ncbi:MAG: cytochrome c3 family protein, partial [Acidobacteriota bacterium]
HSQIVQGEHITVTESTCFICHFKTSEHYPQINRCSHCHIREDLVSAKDSRFDHRVVFESNFSCDKCHSQIIVGDGAVGRENCYKCHFEQERLARYDDTDMMHATHIAAHKIECNQCHLEIQHKIVKDIETIADCRTCHTGFHQAQKILYAGEGGKGVDHPLPNVMLEKGLSCKGCHIFHEEAGGKLIKSDTLVAREKACESCHGRGFARLLQTWQVSTSRKLVEVRAVYEKARGEVESAPSDAKAKARQLLEEAAFNIDIVDKGKAVHNIAYSQDLLLAAFHLIEEALRLAGSSYRPEKLLVETAANPGRCAECHAGIEEISGEVFGMSFPHKIHVVSQKMECGACHSNARRHGEFISSKKACADCHHKESIKECGSCHLIQKTLYGGGRLDGRDVPKDLMAEAEVGCDGCHERSDGKISRSGAATCVNCHEESYRQTFADWQASFNNLRTELERLSKEKKNKPLSAADQEALAEVEKAVRALVLDGSSGVHNSQFSRDLLTKLSQRVKSIQEKAGNE